MTQSPFQGSTWEPRDEPRNFVQYINPSDIGPANSLTITAPAISAKGSGQFMISAASCPYATGAPSIINVAIFKDGVQLPPRHSNTVSGPGAHQPDTLTWIDTVTDDQPHVYSMTQTPTSGQVADSAGHAWITVYEL